MPHRGRARAWLSTIPPIFSAVFAQLLAAGLLWFTLGVGGERLTHFVSPLRLALLQGVIAGSLSFALGQRAWWPAIQFAFWPAVVAAQQLQLSSWIYMVGFVGVLLFYWNTYRTQVPLFLSGLSVWKSLESLLPDKATFRFVDLGCGFGGVLEHLSRARPHGSYLGVELAPLPWLLARLRSRLNGSHYQIARRDYRRLDLGAFDIVFCFLSPAAMPQVWQQARQQMRKGSLLVSCEFMVPGQPPSFELATNDRQGRSLYVWRMP